MKSVNSWPTAQSVEKSIINWLGRRMCYNMLVVFPSRKCFSFNTIWSPMMVCFGFWTWGGYITNGTFWLLLSGMDTMRPPTRPRASRIRKSSQPFCKRWFAADRPAIPAPMITILTLVLFPEVCGWSPTPADPILAIPSSVGEERVLRAPPCRPLLHFGFYVHKRFNCGYPVFICYFSSIFHAAFQFFCRFFRLASRATVLTFTWQ